MVGGVGAELVPESERAFYEAEFAGETLVVGLTHVDEAVLAQIGRVSRSLYRTRGQLVLVVDEAHPADGWEGLLTPALGTSPVVLTVGDLDCEWLAELWLAVADGRPVVVDAAGDAAVTVAGRIASSLRVRKLVVTDPAGGWGEPPRSFADVLRPDQGFAADLADRQDGRVVPAIEEALAGGVLSVNLCRADDLDRELYTFDGTGTLFTSGGYVRVEPLRVADLVEVERLVSQGVDAGVLRPRERHEIARIAVDGLGARVLGGDHLAGIVGMDRDDYRDDGMAEVASLYTVSRFSGSGAGGLLIDALVERAAAEGLAALFAVTVSSEAVEFFLRKGFVEVEHDVVPAAKWRGYDPERRRRAVALLRPTDS
ncbi:MAG: GNAT family N-acetyltransferase [Acidimicrobiales bacterium]|nr:GNAT family N-acetyltransferase [Acidimicrobiales bacterium]